MLVYFLPVFALENATLQKDAEQLILEAEKIRNDAHLNKDIQEVQAKVKELTNGKKFQEYSLEAGIIKKKTDSATSLPVKGKNKDTAIDDILENYNKLQVAQNLPYDKSNIFIFISFGMPENLIYEYFKEAEKLKAILIIRGLLKDSSGKYSIPETSKKILQITNGKGGKVIIHPDLFEMFDIKQAPSIVRTNASFECLENGSACSFIPTFDKIAGSVSIKYALDVFNRDGETKFIKE